MNDIEFSSLMVPIDNKVKGLLRLSVERKIKMLELKIELHRLMFDLTDVKMVNAIMKGIIERCDRNPLDNDSIFGTVSSKVVASFTYNYYQLEDLSEKFKFINEYNDLNEEIDVPKELFNFGMKLFVRDVKRMQRFVNGFLFNYPIILDTLKFIESRTSGLKPSENNGNYIVSDLSSPAAENEVIEVEERTLIDEILEFATVSPQILGYLVHLVFNYYRFFNLSSIESGGGKIKIMFESIFPAAVSVNKPYLLGLVDAIGSVSLDTANLHTKNLAKFMLNYADKLGNIELCCCSFILFFFSLRHLLETHRRWMEKNIEDIFTKPETQIRLLNKYIPAISGIPVEYERCEKTEEMSLESEIKRISEKYGYMKSIDQEKFAEFVFKDSEETSNPAAEVEIGLKNILNVETLLKNAELSSEFVEKLNKNKIGSILSYQKDPDEEKIITPAFGLFLKYVENPVILVTEKNKASQIPNNVLNCFEKLKSLLNDKNFRKENISTFHYYKKLACVLPPDFQFPNMLYIIYQIIIPYMYYFHDTKLFEDVFLTAYKI